MFKPKPIGDSDTSGSDHDDEEEPNGAAAPDATAADDEAAVTGDVGDGGAVSEDEEEEEEMMLPTVKGGLEGDAGEPNLEGGHGGEEGEPTAADANADAADADADAAPSLPPPPVEIDPFADNAAQLEFERMVAEKAAEDTAAAERKVRSRGGVVLRSDELHAQFGTFA